MPIRDLEPLLGLSHPFSAMTHLAVGAFLFLQAWFMLRRAGGDRVRRLSLAIYIIGAGGMFLSSGIYHGLADDHALKGTFWHLDHGGVWVSIAATLTPVQILLCSVATRRRRLLALWSVCLLGVTAELMLLTSLPLWVSPLLYVGMGCVGIPVLAEVYRLHGPRTFGLLIAGGSFASVGGFIDALSAPNLWPGVFEAHELLHVCIVAGFCCFYRANWRYADGHMQPAQQPAPSRETVLV